MKNNNKKIPYSAYIVVLSDIENLTSQILIHETIEKDRVQNQAYKLYVDLEKIIGLSSHQYCLELLLQHYDDVFDIKPKHVKDILSMFSLGVPFELQKNIINKLVDSERKRNKTDGN